MAKPAFRLTYNAPVVLTFSLVAVVVHLLGPLTAPYFVAPARFGGWESILGLFTHVLGHVSWGHLFGNLSYLLLLGPILEERHGSQSLLLMIVITALTTGMANLILFDTGILGASGVVFMFILLASTANIRRREIPLTFVLVAGLWIGGEILRGLRADNTSQFAHIAGSIAGAAFGFRRAR